MPLRPIVIELFQDTYGLIDVDGCKIKCEWMLIRQHWKSIDKCVGFGIAALREMVTELLTNSINVVYNPVFIYVKLGCTSRIRL